MRLRFLIPIALVVALLTGGGVAAHASADRQGSFRSAASTLRAQWDSQQAQGLPASAVAPLRQQLDQQAPRGDWWSPNWFGDDGQALLSRLRSATDAAWMAEVNLRRSAAEAVMSDWTTFATQQGPWVDPVTTAAAAQWPHQLASASTPAAINTLIAQWQATIASQKTAVATAQASAQRAKLDSELSTAGGPDALLATAQRLLQVASSANLDPGSVATLATTLRGELNGSGDALAVADQLITAIDKLQALITLNNHVDGQLRPLLWMVDQAAAEGTPTAASFVSQNAALGSQMRAARTADQLNAVNGSVTALTGQVSAELSADQCGHPVPAGKVITINLTLQEMVFYQDGCALKATPVSTGRPQLRTPTGTFSIFYKKSPFTFVSPWPIGSPFYYYPSPVSWVMEFANDGYFIHDAPWESAGAYGPGSQDNPSAASHGCVHVPTAVMQWAFSWTPTGTPVLISA